MAASILFLLPVLALTAATAHAQPTAYQEHPYASTHAQAVAEFTASVHRYLEVRRLLESPMSRLFKHNCSHRYPTQRDANQPRPEVLD